jgi:endothelin-converting enzyme/putative endopeptidase
MYKSTTDQGKAINLFNSILDIARDKQDIARYDLIWQKIDKVKTQRPGKAAIEMEPIGGILFLV